MSTKSSILLTSDNEHWYYEGMTGETILEIGSCHTISMLANGGIEIILKRNSSLERQIKLLSQDKRQLWKL